MGWEEAAEKKALDRGSLAKWKKTKSQSVSKQCMATEMCE